MSEVSRALKKKGSRVQVSGLGVEVEDGLSFSNK